MNKFLTYRHAELILFDTNYFRQDQIKALNKRVEHCGLFRITPALKFYFVKRNEID